MNIMKQSLRLILAILPLVVSPRGFANDAAVSPTATEATGTNVIAEVLGQPITAADESALIGMIFGTLLEHYATEHQIKPTKKDIEAYLEHSSKQEAESQKRWQQEREETLQQLQSDALEPAVREQLTANLEMLNGFLRQDPRLEKYRREHADQERAMREQIAKQFIQAYKVNQALYEQYGGRVIFQQGGPEPLDAYRMFLKEQEQKGSFKLLDQRFESGFWEYFTNDDMHVFYDKEEGHKVMHTPWWLADPTL